jgi:hypothetical protein
LTFHGNVSIICIPILLWVKLVQGSQKVTRALSGQKQKFTRMSFYETWAGSKTKKFRNRKFFFVEVRMNKQFGKWNRNPMGAPIL